MNLSLPSPGLLSPPKRRRLLGLAYLFAFLLILPSCTREKETTLTISGNIKIDRLSTEDYVNFFFTPIADLILSPLAAYDPRTDTSPLVLASHVISLEGGLVWEVKLREKVNFHDGMPLTSEDVAFSIKERLNQSASLDAISRTEILDRLTLRLTFDSPLGDISDILDAIYVYPCHLLEKTGAWRNVFLKNPVGSGPYRFNGWLENGVELAANKEYFEGRPEIGRIIYLSEDKEERRLRSLLQEEADIMMPVSPKVARFLEKDSKFYVNRLPLPYYTALFLNVQSELFGDHRLRHAVNMAVNRAALIKKGIDGAGVPTYSPFNEAMLPKGYAARAIEYDPKGAFRLLESAGWSDSNGDGILDRGGRRLKFRLLYPNASAEYKKVADLLADQLYEIGMEAETVGVSYEEFDKRIPSLAYDAMLNTRKTSYPEPVWRSGGDAGHNLSAYASREADTFFERLKGAVEPNEVKEIHAMIDRIIWKDAPAVFLYTPVHFAVANRRFVAARDFQGTPYDIYRIKEWE